MHSSKHDMGFKLVLPMVLSWYQVRRRMRMRGVEKQNSVVVTSCMLGSFRTRLETREEFMTLIRGGR